MSNYLSGRTSLTTVQTGDIADDAVSLGKLAAGTDGELLTWNASGDPSAVPVGTATHVLTSNGAGAAPTFQAASGGAWTLIGTAVASSSANLTITGLDSTYDTYAVALSDCVPATDSVDGWFRFGDSSGIDTGASDYGWGFALFAINNTSANWNSSEDHEDAQIKLNTNGVTTGVGNASGEGIAGMFYLNGPGDSTRRSSISGIYDVTDTGGNTYGGRMSGDRETVITLDRILFQFSSGNIATGRMTVWGIAHA